jgi:hypothetical protein
MAILGHFGRVVPAAATAAVVGSWSSPVLAYYPSNFLDQIPGPVTTVPLPPAVIDPIVFPPSPPAVPPTVPPYVPPPTIPPTVVPPTVVPPTVVPPAEEPPVCSCSPPTPQGTPEPATLVSGLIGLAVAGGASKARRRLWPTKG